MVFVGYPKCTTCQKAQKWLDEHGVDYYSRNIKENNPTYDELKTWVPASGLPLTRFFNSSGLLYKSMNLNKEKLSGMSDDECLKLLATNGMLVKRPLLIGDGFVLVGFKENEWQKHGLIK